MFVRKGFFCHNNTTHGIGRFIAMSRLSSLVKCIKVLKNSKVKVWGSEKQGFSVPNSSSSCTGEDPQH
jgi:hypothetical protein